MAVTVSFYKSFIQDLGLARINFVGHTFKAILVMDYEFDADHVSLSDISGELATGNGYTAGGATLTNVDWNWNEDNQFTRFDADDITWSATGGSIGPVTGAIIYNDSITTPTEDRLVCYIDFDVAPLGDLIAEGSDYKLTFHNDGVLAITTN